MQSSPETTKKRKGAPAWLRVTARGEEVVLSFGAVEKPMRPDAAVRLAMQLIEGARACDVVRGTRLGMAAGGLRAMMTKSDVDA